MTTTQLWILSGLVLGIVVALFVILLTRKPEEKPQPPPTTVPAATEPVVTEPPETAAYRVGLCMPDAGQAWTATGEQLQQLLTQRGHTVSLVLGDGTSFTQNKLLLALLEQEVDCVVVAPVDSAGLREAAAKAEEKNIPVISYGSLWMDTPVVKGYVCYDYKQMGAAVAKYIAQRFSLETASDKTYTVELFMGAPEDYNAIALYQGMMEQLQPYLDSGVLICGSGRTAFEDCCISGWSEASAAKACKGRLRSYTDGGPDMILCASDSIAAGVIRTLKENNIPKWPVITGNGATEAGLASMRAGEQALTVETDPALPAQALCDMVDFLLEGEALPFDTSTMFNNVTDIPTALCGFTLRLPAA